MNSDQFTFEYLDAQFWERKGKGAGVLTIDGIEVSKHLHPYSSNSGKTKSWQVTFTFKDESGTRREIKKESQYASNRRNDSERNWGLPE